MHSHQPVLYFLETFTYNTNQSLSLSPNPASGNDTITITLRAQHTPHPLSCKNTIKQDLQQDEFRHQYKRPAAAAAAAAC